MCDVKTDRRDMYQRIYILIGVVGCLMTSTLSAMGVGVQGEGNLSPLSFDGSGMTPGGIQKKYVGLLFDVINTSPSNILANADQFAEHAPYLDGVAIALRNVPALTPEGTVVTA